MRLTATQKYRALTSALCFQLQGCWRRALPPSMIFELRQVNPNIVQRMTCAGGLHGGQRIGRVL